MILAEKVAQWPQGAESVHYNHNHYSWYIAQTSANYHWYIIGPNKLEKEGDAVTLKEAAATVVEVMNNNGN